MESTLGALLGKRLNVAASQSQGSTNVPLGRTQHTCHSFPSNLQKLHDGVKVLQTVVLQQVCVSVAAAGGDCQVQGQAFPHTSLTMATLLHFGPMAIFM